MEIVEHLKGRFCPWCGFTVWTLFFLFSDLASVVQVQDIAIEAIHIGKYHSNHECELEIFSEVFAIFKLADWVLYEHLDSVEADQKDIRNKVCSIIS